MKQPKKIFTRMLINNWGGISHRMMEFHEYVNLFSGKSGSGFLFYIGSGSKGYRASYHHLFWRGI